MENFDSLFDYHVYILCLIVEYIDVYIYIYIYIYISTFHSLTWNVKPSRFVQKPSYDSALTKSVKTISNLNDSKQRKNKSRIKVINKKPS